MWRARDHEDRSHRRMESLQNSSSKGVAWNPLSLNVARLTVTSTDAVTGVTATETQEVRDG